MSNIFIVKGWEQQAYHQIEKTKPIYRIHPFQNRKSIIKIDIMEKDGFMCNLDFKDVYFCILLPEDSRKYVWFY